MPTTETIVADPKEFIPSRVELGFDELGLSVVTADWGDSEHELFLVRQQLGEIPADRHPPNREVVITLKAEKDGAVTLAEVIQKLQMKVGRWQAEGGWVKRVLPVERGYAVNVAAIVHTAALSGIQGWMLAHRGVTNEIILTLTIGPYFYGVKEIESAEFKASEVRQLEYELANVKGTAPGIYRVHVKNEGTKSWMGCIHAMASRDSSTAATAKFSYEAEELTLVGNSTKAAKAGASGGELVKSGSLSSTWVAILGSKIAATGKHLTHVGSQRVVFRLWDPNSFIGNIQLKLEWRPLGSTKWISNDALDTFLVGNYSFVDFGEVRPELAVLGEQRWEFRVLARTLGTVGEEVQLDKAFILPTEQYVIVQEVLESAGGGIPFWEDKFQQTSGVATGKEALIGGKYEGAGDADDFKVNEELDRLERTAKGDEKTDKGRFLVAASSKRAYQRVEAGIELPTELPEAGKFGVLLRYIDEKNWLRVSFKRAKFSLSIGGKVYTKIAGQPVIDKCVAGVVTQLALGAKTTDFRWGGTIDAVVDSKGLITAIFTAWSAHGTWVEELTATDEIFATGKTLAEGKAGFYDSMPSEAEFAGEPRIYLSPVGTTSVSEAEAEQGAVCYPGRAMEFRTDGVYRQHSSEDIWARLTPNGFLPWAPPSGLEKRAARAILLPSVGNFELIPDELALKLSAQAFYFPGYHFASEAA
jgi:hypothetical protein